MTKVIQKLQKLDQYWQLTLDTLTKMGTAGRKFIFLRIRLLPIVIFCSGLLLTVKINVLWKNLHPHEELWGMAESYAQATQKKPSEKEPQKTQKQAPSPPEKGDRFQHEIDADSIAMLTREQFQTLLAVKERLKKSEKTLRKVPEEEAKLSVLDQQIRDHIEALEKTKKRLEALLNQVEEKENVNTVRLVKMTENMKPKEAAQILESLDFPVLLDLMEKIKPKKAAGILSSMSSTKAGYLMTELAKRRKLIKNKKAPKG